MNPIQQMPDITAGLKEGTAILILAGIAVAFYAIEKSIKIVDGYRKRKAERDTPPHNTAIYDCVQSTRLDTQEDTIHDHDTKIQLLNQWSKGFEEKWASMKMENKEDHQLIFKKLDEIRRQV